MRARITWAVAHRVSAHSLSQALGVSRQHALRFFHFIKQRIPASQLYKLLQHFEHFEIRRNPLNLNAKLCRELTD